LEGKVDGTTVVVKCGGPDQLRRALRLSRAAVESHVRLLAENGTAVGGDGVSNCGFVAVENGEVTAKEAVAVDME